MPDSEVDFAVRPARSRRAASVLLITLLVGACADPEQEAAAEVEGATEALTPATLTNWWGWGEVQGGGETTEAVSATSFDQRIYLFAKRKSDGKAMVNSAYNGRAFEGWNAIPGSPTIAGAPAAATLKSYVYAIVRTTNDEVFLARTARPVDRDPASSAPNAVIDWQQWSGQTFVKLQGDPNFRTNAAPSALGMRNHLFVFAKRTSDSRIFVNKAFHDNAFTGWVEACNAGGNCGTTTTATPIGATLAMRLYVFIKGAADRVQLSSTAAIAPGNNFLPQWTNYGEVQNQGGTFTTTTAVGAAGYGDYLFVARRNPADGTVQWNAAKDGEGFNSWQNVPGTMTTSVAPAVAVLNNRIYFFAVKNDRIHVTSASFSTQGGSVAPFKLTKWNVPNVPAGEQREFFSVHAALVRKGMNDSVVVLHGGHAQMTHADVNAATSYYGRTSWTWNPATEAFTGFQNFPLDGTIADHTDPFCNHTIQLPDGKLLAVGGEKSSGQGTSHAIHAALGAKGTFVFDPEALTWTVRAPMANARWYPTPVALPDGRVFVASGFSEANTPGGDSMEPVIPTELYSQPTNSWVTNPQVAPPLQTYPGLHLVPNGALAGKIFYANTRWGSDTAGFMHWSPEFWDSHPLGTAINSGLYDPTTGGWTSLNTYPDNRTEGMSVLRAFGRDTTPDVLVFGGSQLDAHTDARSVQGIALSNTASAWADRGLMLHRRSNVTAVLLPDGKIALIGGQQLEKRDLNNSPVRQIELYDPVTNVSKRDAWLAKPRGYHSEALLLPNGKVFVVGGEDWAQGTRDDQNNKSYELYSPPYLAQPANERPEITAWPSQINYTQPLSVWVKTTGNTAKPHIITKLVLIRPTTVTHHTSSEQRMMELLVNVPPPPHPQMLLVPVWNGQLNSTRLPPGNYMLFALNELGTPSEARWIKLAP